jgi:hypothetical protein
MLWIKEKTLPKFCRIVAEVAEVLPKFANSNGIARFNEK